MEGSTVPGWVLSFRWNQAGMGEAGSGTFLLGIMYSVGYRGSRKEDHLKGVRFPGFNGVT